MRGMVRPYATILIMIPADPSDALVAAANPFIAADVLAILRERGWLAAEPSPEQHDWCERAASMLGGHAADRAALADLLGLVDRKSTRLNSSHLVISYAVFCLKKKKITLPVPAGNTDGLTD